MRKFIAATVLSVMALPAWAGQDIVKVKASGDVASTMDALWRHIRLPAVSNVCIDWGVEAEYYPEIIPDLYAGNPLWVVARLDREPGLVSLCGELNGQPWHHAAAPQPEPVLSRPTSTGHLAFGAQLSPPTKPSSTCCTSGARTSLCVGRCAASPAVT